MLRNSNLCASASLRPITRARKPTSSVAISVPSYISSSQPYNTKASTTARPRQRHSKTGHGDAEVSVENGPHRPHKGFAGRYSYLVFTAGIGEHSARIRRMVCEKLAPLGVKLDAHKNDACRGEGIVSADDSAVCVRVIPTNEELGIARRTYEIV